MTDIRNNTDDFNTGNVWQMVMPKERKRKKKEQKCNGTNKSTIQAVVKTGWNRHQDTTNVIKDVEMTVDCILLTVHNASKALKESNYFKIFMNQFRYRLYILYLLQCH